MCVLYEAGRFASSCIYFLFFFLFCFTFFFFVFCSFLAVYLSASVLCISSCSSFLCCCSHFLFFPLFVIRIFLQYFVFFYICPILYFFHVLCGIRVDQSDADKLWFFYALTQRDTAGLNISEDIAAIIPFPWSQSQTRPPPLPQTPIWLSCLLKGAKYVAFRYEIFLILLSLPPFQSPNAVIAPFLNILCLLFPQ